MAHTDDKKHRPSLTAAMRNTISNEVHAESLRAFRVTALALKRGTKPLDLEKNPHPLPSVARQHSQVELYGAWRHGQDEAVRHWRIAELKEPGGPWAEYAAAITEATVEAENEERAAQAVVEGHIKAGLDKAAPLEAKPEPVTAAIHGYRQQSPERQAVVNQAKLLEAQVLAYIQGLRDGIANDMGELAKELAAYQTDGYQRLSVEEQTARLAAFKARDEELNTAARWLAAGKTNIEVGFMEVNRSTFRPAPVKAPE